MHSLVLDYPKARLHFEATFDTPTQSLSLCLGHPQSPPDQPFCRGSAQLLSMEQPLPYHLIRSPHQHHSCLHSLLDSPPVDTVTLSQEVRELALQKISQRHLLDNMQLSRHFFDPVYDLRSGHTHGTHLATTASKESLAEGHVSIQNYFDSLDNGVHQLVDYKEGEGDHESVYQSFIKSIQQDRVAKIKQAGHNREQENLLDIYTQQEQASPSEQHHPIQPAHQGKKDLVKSFAQLDNSRPVSELIPECRFACAFPFQLDLFQHRAITRLEEGQNVFVAAHTSAGKTVVAEYAIAMALQQKRKVIYTSPIKALSNQKYKELKAKFGSEVGVITGDLQVNPEGSVLIMTTEILRNMLVRVSPSSAAVALLNELSFVIFDEVHYLNNAERGVVWEETILMLPRPRIQLVMLSATVPNMLEFAGWVGRNRQRTVYVQSTTYRPVPLVHHIYYMDQLLQGRSGDDDKQGKPKILKHILKKGEQSFSISAYQQFQRQVKDMLNNSLKQKAQKREEGKANKAERRKIAEKTGHFKEKRGEKAFRCNMNRLTQQHVLKREKGQNVMGSKAAQECKGVEALLQELRSNDELPCVLFMFSKARINTLAQGMDKLTLTTREESKRIGAFIDNCLNRKVNDSDRQLPQFTTMKTLLKRGLGVHHGDLLPIMKEIVEMLFSQGLVKVLLATETFAMGVNMPAKSVVFFGLQKSDGQCFRFLKSSEYVQMSGRAGRRGLDEKGKVIMFYYNNQQGGQYRAVPLPEDSEMKAMIDYKGELLESQFRITYGLILNLLGCQVSDDKPQSIYDQPSGGLQVHDVMQNSFLNNGQFIELPKVAQRITRLQAQAKETQQELESFGETAQHREEYVNALETLRDTNAELVQNVLGQKGMAFLQLRLVELIDSDATTTRALLVGEAPRRDSLMFYVVVLQSIQGGSYFRGHTEETSVLTRDFKVRLVQVTSHSILELGQDLVKPARKVQIGNIAREKETLKLLGEALHQHKGHPSKHINFQQFSEWTQDIRQQQQVLWQVMKENTVHLREDKTILLQASWRQRQIQRQIGIERESTTRGQGDLVQQFQNKSQVLLKLGYIDKDNMPLLKSRLGREMSECNIHVVELVFENLLEGLSAPEAAALLSCFVCCSKAPSEDQEQPAQWDLLPESLRTAYSRALVLMEDLFELESSLGVSQEHTLASYFREYFNPGHLYTVLQWCHQVEFKLIMQNLGKGAEGGVVRTVQRLEMLLRTVRSGAKVIGNYPLAQQMEQAMESIRRDIVFTTSLYLDSISL